MPNTDLPSTVLDSVIVGKAKQLNKKVK